MSELEKQSQFDKESELKPAFKDIDFQKRREMFKDALGRELDPKITDLVVELNRLGVKTEASCEGHEDQGEPFPWIDIKFNSLKPMTEIINTYRAYTHYLHEKTGQEPADVEYVFTPIGSETLRFKPDIPDLEKAQEEVQRFGEFLKKITKEDLEKGTIPE